MNEAKLNTIIKNAFDPYHGYKIPDPHPEVYYKSRKNPYDGYGINKYFICYYETKIIYGISAFAFRKIEAHQFYNLWKIKKAIKDGKYKRVYALIILGLIDKPNQYLFFLDIDFILDCIFRGKKSILKKEINKLINNKMYLSFNSKRIIEFEKIKTKIITTLI